MALLLDTHILTWALSGDRRLSPSLRSRLIETDSELFVSAVIAFEYSDLHNRGRLPRSVPFAAALDALGLVVLDLPADVWKIASGLPNIHRDPTDRLLVAHAIVSDMVIATADRAIERYPVETLS